MDATEAVARVAPDEHVARDWALVLAAAGFPCRIERRAEGWAVVIHAADGARAAQALAGYDADARPEPHAQVVEYGPTRAGIVIAALLLACRPLTGYRADAWSWFLAGQASAAHIVAGQWWRTVTALTLHADAMHLLGNVAAMVVLGTAVCRLLGPGVGAWLMLVAGAGGNAVTAWLRSPSHVAVGASTAIFGAVGILAGLAFVRAQLPRQRPWVPLAAGLALLGFLGTGEHADLAAHFFGFQIGFGLGLAVGYYGDALVSPRMQRILALGAFATLVGCWLLAIGTIPPR